MAENVTPEYQLRASKKYLQKFKEIKLRILPEEYAKISAHAKRQGDRSTTAFIMRCIRETMERENGK